MRTINNKGGFALVTPDRTLLLYNRLTKIFEGKIGKPHAIYDPSTSIREQQLAIGSFAETSLCKYKDKILVRKKPITNINVSRKEIYWLSILRHPNLIRLVSTTALSKHKTLLNLEFGGLSLAEFSSSIKVKNRWLNTYTVIALEIAKGLQYLHHNRVAHGDLKLENIVTFGNKVKLIDLGLSKFIPPRLNYVETSYSGTIMISAPERINQSKLYLGFNIYIFGCLLIELAVGTKTHSTISHSTIHSMLAKGYRFNPPDYLPVEIYELILKCFAHIPSLRPTASELVSTLEKLAQLQLSSNLSTQKNKPVFIHINTMRKRLKEMKELEQKTKYSRQHKFFSFTDDTIVPQKKRHKKTLRYTHQ